MKGTTIWGAGVVLLMGCSAANEPSDAAAGTGATASNAGTAGSAAGSSAGGESSSGGLPGSGGTNQAGAAQAGSNQAGSATGGTSSGGSGGSSSPSGGNSGGGVVCGDEPANPLGLEVGVWTNITPPDPQNPGEEDHDFVNDIQFDPSHPSTIYVLNKGVEKSTDGGVTWDSISSFWLPQRIRIDPSDSEHLLTIQGVHATGFFATTNGGATWDTPAGFTAILGQIGNDTDMYGLEVDPEDFGHFLLTFHWYWDGCTDGCKSGVVECFDSGATCTVRPAIPGVTGNGGYNAFFLSNPALGLGDSKTWIFMTQPGGSGEGFWRTTDSGTTWNQASLVPMIHGGSQIYYASDGTLYAAAWNSLRKSTDNGASWSDAWTQGLFGVQGDGTNLYVISHAGGKFQTTPEVGGGTWADYTDKSFGHSASNISYDPCNHILYGAMREDGAWAVKVE